MREAVLTLAERMVADARNIRAPMKRKAQAILWALTFTFPVLAVGATDVVSIWGGARGTVVRKSDGTVWTWGANFGGKLGVGLAQSNLNRVLVPTEVHDVGNVGFLHSVTAIMGGEVHNIALKADGTVWGWGINFFGQVGNGTTNDASTPMQTSGLNSVIALGGRGYHTLAIESDGSVWGWGWNNAGELGDGTTNRTTVPVKVVGLTNPAVVSAGYKFSIALMTNGTVFQWGHGRVIATNFAPIQVAGLSNIIAISAGWDHALALRSDHTVWTWGQNNYGEIGDGGAVNRTNPVQVTTLSNIVAVSGGDWHSSALGPDGMIWKWGRNDTGQLGNGTADSGQHPLPVKIQLDNNANGFSNVVLMAARDYHNIAIKADGSVWQWGANDQGQCGDNTTVDRWRPVQVTGLGARMPLTLNVRRSAQPGYADLRWVSATGEYFAIEYRTNPSGGFASVLLSNILATPPANIISVPMTNAQRYYRLKF
jgi:alpha-tubulin suppressor-like RCC1 family protein